MRSTAHEQELPAPCTIVDVMAVGRVSKSTAYRWVRSGKVPSARIGRKFLIPRDALVALLTPVGKVQPMPPDNA